MAGYKLIVNPLAGRNKAEELLPLVLETLAEGGIRPDVACTERHLHAVELAQQAVADGYDVLLAMGGDGTTNEVVNGMMAHYDGEPVGMLGIIPAGSGNDFCIALDWPRDAIEACRRVGDARTQLIDVGQINDRYFINVAGAGFDTLVTIEAANMRRLNQVPFLRGFPLYFLAVFKTLLLNYHSPITTIELDGQKIVQPTLLAAVANGRQYGGGFLVAPDAIVGDGWFDITYAGDIDRVGILKLLPHFIKGTHIGKKKVFTARAREVTIESELAQAAQIDGEIYMNPTNRLEFKLLPCALRVLC